MAQTSEQTTRDRAIWFVRLGTFAGAACALGLSWTFSNLSLAYFSGKPPAPTPVVVPVVPSAAAPVQKPPTVIQTVVRHPYQGGSAGGYAPAPAGSAPRPPGAAPAPAPPPPPPPACHSTPSKPC
jgi:hypothetical protein